MGTIIIRSIIILLALFTLPTINSSFTNGSSNIRCVKSEKLALLIFKQHLVDPTKRLRSWVHNEDCCRWFGVVCDTVTGHVLELHLGNPTLDNSVSYAEYKAYERSRFGGKINQSLLNLKHLSYLDLSNNAFGGIQIPKFFGSMESLSYLNLANAGFGGLIPHRLGNLSNMQYLDLQGCDQEMEMHVENLSWLSGISPLKYLAMSCVNLSKVFDWLHVVNKFPSLKELHFSTCELPPPFPVLYPNFSSLAILNLQNNNLESSPVLSWIFNLKILVSLDLSSTALEGPIPVGLQNLTSLKHLDLSFNNFNSSIPDWLYSFSPLEFLRLRFNSLQGPILVGPQNLTFLRHLDLSFNNFNSSIPNWLYSFSTLEFLSLSFNSLQGPIPVGLQNLTSLRHLGLWGNFFISSIPDWLYSFSPLEFLRLNDNFLQGQISSAIGNMTSAIILDLSRNYELNGRIPRSVGNLCKLRSLFLSNVNLSQKISDILEILSKCVSIGLEYLNLGSCQLSGQLTNDLGHFKILKVLHLFNNSISGSIPHSLRELSRLRLLVLSKNKLKGNFSELLPSSLEFIKISFNSLEGVVNETHFANLTKLIEFSGNDNSLILKVHPDWIPPFQLFYFHIRSWNLNYQFPIWLHSQKNLVELDISNTGISDSISSQFWNMASQFSYLNISNNQIYGKIPYIPLLSNVVFDFSSNSFSGSLPRISSKLQFLNLSNNSLSGSLSYFLCNRADEMMQLSFLDLSENLLIGVIPDCWMKWPNMRIIRLNSNKFTSSIPSSLGSTLRFLVSLHLQKNKLSGELPLVLKNCTNLSVLDISENEFNGPIPSWLGLNHQILKVLILRSNKFHGHIPNELCALDSLQILDLSHNNLSGDLPKCIGNFSAMFAPRASTSYIGYSYASGIFYSSFLMETVLLVMKGYLNEYRNILGLVKSIDLSENNLQGRIPDEITRLQGLKSLNLSHNHLIGRIPEGIGAMTSLESLDFSADQLSGSIPQSMSNLTFLSHLNLSNNNLIGKIPSSTQLQSFDSSSFIGNRLCGLPLTKNCSEIPSTRNEGKYDGNGIQVDWFYVMMAIGFAAGFGAILVPLMLSRWWRFQYFQFLDRMWTRLVLLYAKATRFHAS